MNTILQITNTLTKERDNNLQLQKQYTDIIAQLPKGTISTRETFYGNCFYLNYYCKASKKPISKYIKDKSTIPDLKIQIARRQQLEKGLKDLEKDLEAIEKMLIIANKRIQQESVRGKLKETGENPDASTVLPSQTHAIDMQKTALIGQREHERK